MPNSSRSSVRAIRFDEFEVDLSAGQLRKGGQRVKIQDLPFRLLVALLDRPGEIVTREQLRNRLWGDTFVDFDDGLHTAIRKLRDVLGDSATHPRFIETVPRRGYCFIAPVSTVAAGRMRSLANRNLPFRNPHSPLRQRLSNPGAFWCVSPKDVFGFRV